MSLSRAFTHALAACLLLACFRAGRAQDAAPRPAPSAPFRVGLLVADAKNRSAGDLRKEDLRIRLGGVEQAVSLLAKDESPVSYGLVVDNSGSLHRQIDAVVAAAQSLVRQTRPGDEGFLVRFVGSENIKLFQDFTSDPTELVEALDSMYIEAGQTALTDAVHLAAEHLVKKGAAGPGGPRRRVLILISDGDDRASYYRPDDVLRFLREHDVEVFCVGLPRDLSTASFTRPSQRAAAVSLLKRLSKETGGRAFFADNVGELKEAVAGVADALRARYVVEFAPAGKDGQPASGKLEIEAADAAGLPGREVFYRQWSFKKGEPERKK
ncbi:MAG TPA: VWA domain-containing protein [Pyrinomonadaceae bacterium]|nr:VWA domain-containing protein [Pyrinomonadaceae bacterium]